MAVRLCLTLLATAVVASPLFAQGDPAAQVAGYGVPHLFGLPTATTTRLFGMGGITACIPDSGFPNPAFAGDLTTQNAGARYSLTDFDLGLKLKGLQGWYSTPVGSHDGIQVLAFWLDSDPGTVLTVGGALTGRMYEGDISIHYGRRVHDQVLVGIGLSPVLSTATELTNPVGGGIVQTLQSRVGIGARLGAVYEFDADSRLGIIVDRYTEDVTMVAPVVVGPIEFDAWEYAFGVSHRVSPRLLVAAEWCELRNKANTVESIASGWHFGAEYNINPDATLRVGSNDGQLSAGFGYDGGRWAANYAYIKDWNNDLVGAALGGSDTQQIEVTTSW